MLRIFTDMRNLIVGYRLSVVGFVEEAIQQAIQAAFSRRVSCFSDLMEIDSPSKARELQEQR